ncbi:amidohydrolase family protein [Paraflavitalea pollutisoli]|uniref:amidohydrolase family protein n=1 Tax=Paraflavitalea pollutisoli TaxID=3034143 RepID=UPI0023ECCD56|nr:amidohydrolase family protein [Paraflavitalea sp. H1-2-19X]
MRKRRLSPPGRALSLMGLLLALKVSTLAQSTFPVNGVADPKNGYYAFTNATIVKDAQTTLSNATLVIRDGKIVSVGANIAAPKDAVVVDCKGKFIYPSFIDAYSDYGITAPTRTFGGFNFNQPAQITSNQKGAFGWNQAIRADVEGAKLFNADEAKAKTLRDIGFGTVLTHQKDGIARGTGAVVTLANEKENLVLLKEKASAHYSLNKGVSTQSYPSSMMGVIALLRQSYIDAAWYKSNPAKEGTNLTLKAWNDNQSLPQILEANDKWNVLRADRVGDEFGVQYIIKAGGNEYQRIKEMAETKAAFILPLNYPTAMDVEDPNDIRFTGLDDMKHWELAPTNAGAFEKANITFCLTTSDLANVGDFFANLRKAIEYGLSETKALEALTKTPATLLGIADKTGSLDAGKLANFLVTSGPIFQEKTVVFQNWVQGRKYGVKEDGWNDVKGTYKLAANTATGAKSWAVELKDGGVASFVAGDTLTGKYTYDGKLVKLSFTEGRGPRATETVMSGVASGDVWNGAGRDGAGNKFTWTATLEKAAVAKADSVRPRQPLQLGKVTFPFLAYGTEEVAKQETILIKNATVWTSEKDGKLEGTDVLVIGGKINKIGKNLSAAGAKVIDGTGKHLTAGIIDEHSHIAAASINEGAQSVTSEVRISDNLNPEDINIYRQLSGGVTTSHILHGSANTIGGQTQLIKLRWGGSDEDLKFKGSDPFIKFALGENVKRSSSSANNRFPDSRMGVEQVLNDAFQRAKDYEAALKAKKPGVRRDLELDALVEIMNKKRFITMHSYVQSEITAALRVAEKFGFRINTLTHILEGYKVADKMKAHGVNASTFSDWWQYKMEVVDAIPYNAAIMTRVGLNVAINSDDAEMARRLNQEAGKIVKYGGVSEEEALKMVTINPAKMLHVDDKVGSIKVGKDADLVLWSNNPLSIYAVAEKTIVDGTLYFDREKDKELRAAIQAERTRLISKLAAAKRTPGAGGAPAGGFGRPRPRYEVIQACMDHLHSHGLLAITEEEAELLNEK